MAWQQSEYSFQITVLGCVLSVLGFCSISIDALAFVAQLRQDADKAADWSEWEEG